MGFCQQIFSQQFQNIKLYFPSFSLRIHSLPHQETSTDVQDLEDLYMAYTWSHFYFFLYLMLQLLYLMNPVSSSCALDSAEVDISLYVQYSLWLLKSKGKRKHSLYLIINPTFQPDHAQTRLQPSETNSYNCGWWVTVIYPGIGWEKEGLFLTVIFYYFCLYLVGKTSLVELISLWESQECSGCTLVTFPLLQKKPRKTRF